MARIFGIVSPRAELLSASMGKTIGRGHVGFIPEVVTTVAGESAVLGVLDRQPHRAIATVDRLTVVVDGAIFNRRELGVFQNDAHLVAELFRKHGFESLLTRLNGDFSIALYDGVSSTLWLARDRLGVKPLYYTSTNGELGFASRPWPLTKLPGIGTDINRRFAAVFAASHYRYFDNVPVESPYERVAQLPAAHWLRFDGDNVRIGRYWQIADEPDFVESEAVLAERYRELLLDAVILRVASAKRPAFTLSGGMDSSSVLASARYRTGTPQPAFSTVYSDKTFDESEEIRPMLDGAVSTWHPVLVDHPDVFNLVRRMVEANDEPVATATWLSHFVLCERVAKEGFDALFGGLGGDELNAGEYEYFFFHFADLMQAKAEAQLQSEMANWAANHDHPLHRKNPAVAAAVVERCTDAASPGRCRPDVLRMRRYYSALQPDFFAIEQFIPVMEAPFSSYLKTRSYQDLTRETAPCCLRAEDRHTQAWGIENHLPFFDHRLIEFMFRIPGTLKIRQGVTKILLRSAMRGILPEVTRTRVKKTGWNAPAHLWFAGAGKNELQDLIRSRAFKERGIYDIEEVLRLVEEHDEIVTSGAVRENHMMFLWQLVNLELWLQSLESH